MNPRRRFFVVSFLVTCLFVSMALWTSHNAGEEQSRNQDLIMACQIGNVDQVRTLLAQGADPNTRDVKDSGSSGLWDWLMRLLRTRQDSSDLGATALACAARSRHPYETAKLLIDHGADVKAPDSPEGSTLFWAARDGDSALVQLLLDRGVNPNTTDSFGFSPLRGAVLARSAKTVKLLLDRGETIRPADVAEANAERQPEVQRLLSPNSPTK